MIHLSTIPLMIISALLGALNVLAFAPFGWWPLQIVLLALLFSAVLRSPSIKRTALITWAYGFGWSACGVCWLFISMHRYGGMSSLMAAIAVGLMGLLLGAFPALAMACATWMQQGQQRRALSATVALLLVFPTMWALSEWLRGWVFTGFPWLVSGYAHTTSPLAGYAPIIGVYGLGYLSALIAACIALLPVKKLALVGALLIGGGGLALQSINWTQANGLPISVRLLQGNVPQEMKFNTDKLVDTLLLYNEMIRQAPADLIATPETALPLLMHQLPPDYLPRLSAYAQQTKSHIAIGIPVSDGPFQYANSVIGLAPNPSSASSPFQYRYDKHHLVPFGEFIPMGFRWFVDMMRIPLGDFTRAPLLQAPFAVRDQWVLPNICYEDLFGEEIAEQIAASYFKGTPQASILLNVSNIAWFGDSLALPQHLQISQMRALETGRPMLRATNTGTTAVIDTKGRVSAQLPTYQRGVLTANVQGYSGVTPYILIGNTGIIGFILALICISFFLGRKTR